MAHVTDVRWLDEGDGRWLTFNWHAGVHEFHETLAALKAAVPIEARRWDEDRRCWSVREDWVPAILPLFSNLAGNLEQIAKQGSLF